MGDVTPLKLASPAAADHKDLARELRALADRIDTGDLAGITMFVLVTHGHDDHGPASGINWFSRGPAGMAAWHMIGMLETAKHGLIEEL